MKKIKIEEMPQIKKWFKNLLGLTEKEDLPEIGPGPYLIEAGENNGIEYVMRVMVFPGNEFQLLERYELMPLAHKRQSYQYLTYKGSIKFTDDEEIMDMRKRMVVDQMAQVVREKNLVIFHESEFGEEIIWNFVCLDPRSKKEIINF